jgi:hypothetical protein
MKKIIAINILVLLILSLLSSLAFAADSTGSEIISVSLVNQDPDPATAGEVVEVRIGIENEGSVAADDVMLEVVPEYPFTVASGASAVQVVGTLKAYQTGADMKIVKFKLLVDKDATAGDYELKVKEYEEDKKSVSAQTTLTLAVESKESAEVIYIDKTLLVPGKEDTLEFTINNVGNAPLKDLSFSWVNEDKIILPVGSDNTKYIKYIDVGESVTLKYKVIADTDVDAGLYELNLKLTYDDTSTGEEKEINTIAGVYVGGGTDFDVAFSETSSGETSFTIANIGSNPAFSVSVIVPEQDGWTVSGSNSMIIGNLNTGDYTVASFSLSQQRGSLVFPGQRDVNQTQSSTQRSTESQNTLKVQVAYTDTRGQREIVEKEVAMNTQSLLASTTTDSETTDSTAQTMPGGFRRVRQQSFFSKYKWYIAVLVILLIFGTGFWKYRKEKALNHNYKVKDLFKSLLNVKALFKKKSKVK